LEASVSKVGDSARIFSEFVRFARKKRVYWIVPLILMLGLTALLLVAGQAAAPLLYTLF
jgi:hypothetical protein